MAKIIQVTTFFHPILGGVEQEVLDLSNQLIKEGHEVTVFCSNSTRSRKKIKKLHDKIGKIKIRRFRTWFSFSQFYKIYPQIFFTLLKTDFDIVHVHSFRRFEVYPALLAAKIKRKQIILTTHNPFTAKGRSRLLNLFVSLHDATFGKWFTRYIDHIICLLNEEILYLERYKVKRNNISVIPNGISNSLSKKGNPKKFIQKYHIPLRKFKYLVLWVGRVNTSKGLENLEIAIKQLPDVLFVFVGPNGKASKYFKDLYRDNRNVLFTGSIPHREILNAFSAADLLVLPSEHETFGVVILESIAQGVPVISTNRGGPKEIVKDSFGIIQDPYDKWAWFLNIKKVLNNSKLKKEMSKNAKLESKKYNWDNLIHKVLEVYKLKND